MQVPRHNRIALFHTKKKCRLYFSLVKKMSNTCKKGRREPRKEKRVDGREGENDLKSLEGRRRWGEQKKKRCLGREGENGNWFV